MAIESKLAACVVGIGGFMVYFGGENAGGGTPEYVTDARELRDDVAEYSELTEQQQKDLGMLVLGNAIIEDSDRHFTADYEGRDVVISAGEDIELSVGHARALEFAENDLEAQESSATTSNVIGRVSQVAGLGTIGMGIVLYWQSVRTDREWARSSEAKAKDSVRS
ncbi:MAG: hypothetical protein U5L95_03670 [Candidatus Saccharibacteria bacterium]|nr:hypothetical protein [Candidatus Saccharibacteria bacterium]